MKKFPIKLLLLGILFMTTASSTLARADNVAIAIVVHPDTKITELSMGQLQKIFLGDQQFWPDKSRITLLVRAPEAVERNLVLNKIYHMSEAQFRQYWVAKMFRAEVTSGPKLVFSASMASDLLTVIPGSITFMDSKEVNDKIKVLRIDGLLPSDNSYPLRSN